MVDVPAAAAAASVNSGVTRQRHTLAGLSVCLSAALVTTLRTAYTVKISVSYIYGYFVESFPDFNGTGSIYVYISVDRRNNEAWAHIAVRAKASLFRRLTDTNVYGTGSVKI